MRKSEHIRGEVVKYFVGAQTFTTRDVVNSIFAPEGVERRSANFDRLVSQALREWVKRDLIFKRYRLEDVSEGRNGRYRLVPIGEEAALPGGQRGKIRSSQIAAPKAPKFADVVGSGGRALIGQILNAEVRDVKPDGSMLVDIPGAGLFALRKIDW